MCLCVCVFFVCEYVLFDLTTAKFLEFFMTIHTEKTVHRWFSTRLMVFSAYSGYFAFCLFVTGL